MDGLQILLSVIVVLLTTLLVVVGVQAFLVIYDLRRTVKKLNRILEDSVFGGGLLRPEKLSGILELLKKTKKLETRGTKQMD